jgi:taurine dioxygenase
VAGIARRVPRGRQNSDEWWASWPPHLPHDVVVPRQEGRAGTGHPLVDRRVPDGRRFLRVGDHAWRVSGLEAGASNELLSDLHDAIDQPRATWRQDWQLGDAIFYDNRMILHRRGGSAGTPPERVLRRTLAAWPDQAASADV